VACLMWHVPWWQVDTRGRMKRDGSYSMIQRGKHHSQLNTELLRKWARYAMPTKSEKARKVADGRTDLAAS
jgi:hypothetical protein